MQPNSAAAGRSHFFLAPEGAVDGFEDNLEVEKVLLRFHIPKLLRHVGGDFPIYKFNTGSAIFIA